MKIPGDDTTDTMDLDERRLVLIADGQQGRGQRVAAECELAGYQWKIAAHGAQALEIALATKPDLVVTQIDLPLVDAFKLAEIMRANPMTRSARFLMIGDPESQRALVGVGDRVIEATRRPNEIVECVTEMFVHQRRIEMLEDSAPTGEVTEGQLEQLSLAELLQSFMQQRRNGALFLDRTDDHDHRHRARLLIRDGEVLQAEVGRVDGEKALFRLMSWRTGRFRFEPGARDETPTILAPTRRLLVEGVRQLEEWDRLSTQLPPTEAPVRLAVKSADLPNIVHPLTQEVLLLLEDHGVVGDVVDHSVFPDYQVLRTLHTLHERGIIELNQAPLPAPVSRPHPLDRLFNEAQARRLRDWLHEATVRGGDPPDAKLLVVGSSADGAPEFVRLLADVPGVELTREVRAGRDFSGDLVTLGRVDVDDEIGIELVHVPVGQSFSPVWPLAAHGALGTLFLLTGSLTDAAERVTPFAEAVQKRPRARTFHVALLGKDERIAPDELRENLSLLDEASLFLLPIESSKSPSALVRSLFARVMP